MAIDKLTEVLRKARPFDAIAEQRTVSDQARLELLNPPPLTRDRVAEIVEYTNNLDANGVPPPNTKDQTEVLKQRRQQS